MRSVLIEMQLFHIQHVSKTLVFIEKLGGFWAQCRSEIGAEEDHVRGVLINVRLNHLSVFGGGPGELAGSEGLADRVDFHLCVSED